MNGRAGVRIRESGRVEVGLTRTPRPAAFAQCIDRTFF